MIRAIMAILGVACFASTQAAKPSLQVISVDDMSCGSVRAAG